VPMLWNGWNQKEGCSGRNGEGLSSQQSQFSAVCSVVCGLSVPPFHIASIVESLISS
jgi:hypothetical protein